MTTQPARDEFFEALLGDFLDESAQLLDRLNEDLLRLDQWVQALGGEARQHCDADLMNDMFRSAHSLKGLSGMLGLQDINHLTHKVENLFDAARQNQLQLTSGTVELLFQACDRLVAMVDELKSPTPSEVDCDAVVEQIAALLQAAGVEKHQTSQAEAERSLAALTAEAANAEAHPMTPQDAAPQDAAPQDAAPPQPATPAPVNLPAVEPAKNAGVDASPSKAPVPRVDIPDPLADVVDEEGVPAKYMAIFIDEAELALDNLTETLLALEGGADRAALETLMGISHKIKGGAASLGMHRAAKVAHQMEDILQRLIDQQGTLSPELADALLKCTDGLRAYVEQLKTGQRGEDNFGPLWQLLWLAHQAPAPVDSSEAREPSAATSGPSTTTDHELEGLCRQWAPRLTGPFLVGCVRFAADTPLVGLKANLVYEKLSAHGKVVHLAPSLVELEELETLDRLEFGLATEDEAKVVEHALRIGAVIDVQIMAGKGEEMTAAEKTAVPAPPDAAPTAPAAAVAATVPPVAKPNPASANAAPAKPGPNAAGPVAPAPAAKVPTPVPPAAKPAPPAKSEAAAPKAEEDKKPNETLRVDIERLDQLMNLAGELVINKARLSQIGTRLKSAVNGKRSANRLDQVAALLERLAELNPNQENLRGEMEGLASLARLNLRELEVARQEMTQFTQARSSINDLVDAVHQLDRVTDGIQKSVMDTRMVPIGPLFTRFRRVVRDITRGNGKEIELVIRGEKTELDKRMIDELGDPLIHMVRNSADHGVELPADREAAGKPRTGVISLDANHRGNSIVIQVRDDGRGLNTARIKAKAIDRGLITAADAERMTDQQINNLIWEPGLSTAEKVTEISGRGMGMDIVKSKIESLNGLVEVESHPGAGSVFTIKLPLTLAILPSLMAQIEGDVFALPIETVVEIVRVRQSDILSVHGQRTARVRGRVISLVYLAEIFEWNNGPVSSAGRPTEDTTLVVLGSEGRQMGLAVDKLLGEEDVVIKSMAENFHNVYGIAGASILGNGQVSLILDVPTLIEMAARPAGSAAVSAAN